MELEKAKEKEESFSEDFPMFDLPQDGEEDEEVVFFLMTSVSPIYDIFCLSLPFLGDGYSLAPTSGLITSLCSEKNIPLQDTLRKIIQMHSSYVTILRPDLS